MIKPRVTVSAIEAEVEIDPTDVLDELPADEIVEYYGDELLEHFDRDHVINYFGIQEAE